MNKRTGRNKVLVIAHDAGGAEIIAAYVKAHKEKKFSCYVQGPAVTIFRREHIEFKRIMNSEHAVKQVIEVHGDVEYVLLGTGWMTRIEARALAMAKKKGMKTVCYLESWVNYRERFGYPAKGWRRCLPDEIWVGDEYALALAEKYFSSYSRVRFVPNQYFKNIKKRAILMRKQLPKPQGVLFLSDAVVGVEQVLEEFLQVLLGQKIIPKVILGLHPADARTRYDAVIKKYEPKIDIRKTREKDLVRNLLSVETVIGAETVALVSAFLVGKRSICVKKEGKVRRLPFREIIYVSDIRKLTRLI